MFSFRSSIFLLFLVVKRLTEAEDVVVETVVSTNNNTITNTCQQQENLLASCTTKNTIMRIVLIAPGYTPFPPKGWGAVESIVWDYYENLLKRHYDVYIVNQYNTTNIIIETNQLNPDVVHIMYDDYIVVAPHLICSTIFYTSHYAYITHPNFETEYQGYFYTHFYQVLQNKDRVIINAISEEIKQVYVKYGFPSHKVRTFPSSLYQYHSLVVKQTLTPLSSY